jgi:hypothetical protein
VAAAGPVFPKPSKSKKQTAVDLEKPIGHDHYPITGYSLTISKVKGDIPANIIDIVGDFISTSCIRGLFVSFFNFLSLLSLSSNIKCNDF